MIKLQFQNPKGKLFLAQNSLPSHMGKLSIQNPRNKIFQHGRVKKKFPRMTAAFWTKEESKSTLNWINFKGGFLGEKI